MQTIKNNQSLTEPIKFRIKQNKQSPNQTLNQSNVK